MKIIEEASTLGLKPGEWPETIEYRGLTYQRNRPEMHNGELVSVVYLANGVVLVVLND